MPVPRPYHHGDLRNALLDAGLVILETEGLAALTLRTVSARAGVSHAAPAHHFGNVRGLLTALAARAFTRFDTALSDARHAADPAPDAQIRATGRAYLTFAREHPGLFRLMFTARHVDWRDEALARAAAAAYRHLAEISAPAAAALGAHTDAERTEVENLVWAVSHGFAHLAIEQQIPKPGQPTPSAPPDIARLLFGRRNGAQADDPAS